MVKTAVTEVRLGQKVISTRGRDAGSIFLVVGLLNEDYVLVADGRKRSMERPKKKNRKHLSLTLQVDTAIAKKLSAGQPVADEEIVDAIQRLGENLKEGEVNLGER
ncbi:MAG TPA: RNA-binding protein [Firmicutes bacterium]|uniref:RNA-binding protein n=1 Tax=Capillibacterium thermochitinicola TaxID=2699427 RepID=A0A8J6I0Q5_9FIRM|nr:KOW domain-containing RNA-binding protein [Capillibacterium thermochitinicola]MBA2132549.1 RNA-binding protein [Capillibacterium thermochitinicola]HHW11550.1 RNA-binding protein [Bacillota bacterium]